MPVPGRPLIVADWSARFQFGLWQFALLVGDDREQVGDAVEPGSRLSSASTSYQGESGRSQWANISSFALEYSTQRLRPSRSMSESFQRLRGSFEPVLEPALLLLVTH